MSDTAAAKIAPAFGLSKGKAALVIFHSDDRTAAVASVDRDRQNLEAGAGARRKKQRTITMHYTL
jgi:hypothetical protein